jgi:hypothetical protein
MGKITKKSIAFLIALWPVLILYIVSYIVSLSIFFFFYILGKNKAFMQKPFSGKFQMAE